MWVCRPRSSQLSLRISPALLVTICVYRICTRIHLFVYVAMCVCVSVSLVLEVARARVLLRAWRTLLYSQNERDDRVTTNQADDLRAPLEKWGGNFICMGQTARRRDRWTGATETIEGKRDGRREQRVRVDSATDRERGRGNNGMNEESWHDEKRKAGRKRNEKEEETRPLPRRGMLSRCYTRHKGVFRSTTFAYFIAYSGFSFLSEHHTSVIDQEHGDRE